MAKKNQLVVAEIEPDKVKDLRKKVFDGSRNIEEIVNHLVSSFCSELDAYMVYIKEVLTSDTPPTPEELDDFILNLPMLIYFTSEAQETLGIREDVAKAIRAEQYNKIYASVEGTIPEKDSATQLQTQEETIVQMAYSRAYKKIKERLTAAYEMISSVKKVISRRMQEIDFNKLDKGQVRITNPDTHNGRVPIGGEGDDTIYEDEIPF